MSHSIIKFKKEILPIHRYLQISQKYGHSDHYTDKFCNFGYFFNAKKIYFKENCQNFCLAINCKNVNLNKSLKTCIIVDIFHFQNC